MVVPYATNYISGGNDSFAPPQAGSTTTNVYGAKLYPTTAATSTGWSADYAPVAQVKTTKDANGVEIAFSNPLVAAAYPGVPSKGALRQNGGTSLAEITDGTSSTTLYSEAAGRTMQYTTGNKASAYNAGKVTGMIWADADNRITVTGSSADGTGSFGAGSCAMNCNNLQGDIYAFHTGGANVAFCDGHVQFVRSSVNIAVLAALVTKAGGEVIDPSSY